MDKRQQLKQIIIKAQLPAEVERLLLAEVDKQKEMTDAFILDVADTLERIGMYLKLTAETQNAYLDIIVAEAQKVNGAYQVLESIEQQLEKMVQEQSKRENQDSREKLQILTGSAKPTS
ncbi:hypothetical protein HYV22_03375 [Candidatus Gottesmanbacteria bacterium]|nr:hypothetical protein [Candidatus Gottesmanbacteria bacterium]